MKGVAWMAGLDESEALLLLGHLRARAELDEGSLSASTLHGDCRGVRAGPSPASGGTATVKVFRPAPPLVLTASQCERITKALTEKSTLESHSIRSVSGISDADAVLLMFQLHNAGLVDLRLRAFDASNGLALADIPYNQGFLPLPYAVPYREEPLSDPDDVRYGLVIAPCTEIVIA